MFVDFLNQGGSEGYLYPAIADDSPLVARLLGERPIGDADMPGGLSVLVLPLARLET